MFFRQIYEPGLAHASYMVGCQKTKECLVIDAKRDIDTYLEIAKQEGLTVTHLTETHIHADFLSGTRELAAVTGAPMMLSDEGGTEWQYDYAHQGLRDGDTFMVGNIKIQVMHTPGHTPEHISFLVTDTPAIADQPIMIFTGDFVFVGDVGRPDLLETAAGYRGTMEVGARQMWQSLKKFRALPDHIQVHPAHGAGSACGKALGAIPSSTVGYEKLVNWALRHTDEEAFVAELLSGQPEPPTYFAMMKKLNKIERALLPDVPPLKGMSASEFEAFRRDGGLIIDTRSKVSFANGHVPGSINIQNNKAFSTWAGWMISYDKPFVLVVTEEQCDEVTRKLMRIGLDNAVGFITNVTEWQATGNMLSEIHQMHLEELAQKYNDASCHVLDVRGYSEYESGHIPGCTNIHVGYLRDHLNEIPRNKPVVVACQGGDRSSIASSYLMREGFTNILNFPQGFADWQASGTPVEKGHA
ncbi:MAG: MBL fold metallo-hydrolase [Ignavibacteria bacterium]|nr:MBL fold metallo-hydrolase [Ignavibacteria bacterium]